MQQASQARRLMRAGHRAATRDNLEDAASLFTKAVETCPSLPQPHIHLARTRLLLGDREGAVAAARDAIRHGADLPAAQLLGAVTLYDAGEFEDANAALTRVLEINPENDLAQAYRALLHWRDGGDMKGITRLARKGMPESSAFLARLLLLTEEEFLRRESTPSPCVSPCEHDEATP